MGWLIALTICSRARLQYQCCDASLKQNPAELVEQLEVALKSHRHALTIDPDNPDALFNTSQVLSSLADAIDGIETLFTPVSLLEEAVVLLQRCLFQQELSLSRDLQSAATGAYQNNPEQSQTKHNEHQASTHESLSEEAPEEEEERWALMQQPVSESSILDTAIAILEDLASLCDQNSFGASVNLGSVRQLGTSLVHDKILPLASSMSDEDKAESDLVGAKFNAALSEAEFRSAIIDSRSYDQQVQNAFTLTEHGGPEVRAMRVTGRRGDLSFMLLTNDALLAPLVCSQVGCIPY